MLYPKSNQSRSIYSLNGIWNFQILNESYCPRQALESPRMMAVPASYNDLIVEKEVIEHVGEVVYEKNFSLPVSVDKIYRLRIGATSHKCKVYLNGQLIGEGINGYFPIDCKLEGLKEENRLSVVIDNRLTFQTLPVGKIVDGKQIINHDFYNYTGIHRDVCVYSVPKDYIEDIVIHTVVDGDYSKVKVDLMGNNKNPQFIVRDAKGVEIVCSNEPVFTLPNAELWTPSNPYLYTLIVKTETDSYEETFGVRKVEATNKELLLNGKPIYLKGFGMHEDFYLLGKGNNTAVSIRNFELLKWIGANSVRTSHYPYSEEFMDLADRYGILVIDELPAVGMNWWHDNFMPDRINEETLALHKELTTQLIARDKNHPCIVMLSVSNEAGTHEPTSRPYFEELINHARKITELPIINVEFTKHDDGCQVADLVDVIGLNRYYGWYTDHGNLEVVAEQMQTEMEKFYNTFKKPILITEYGTDTIEGLHSIPSETFSEEFQKEYMEECGKAFDACDFCIGEQVWNFADFKTKQGLTRVRGNRKGIFTKDRQPKQAAHYLKDRWKKL